MYPAPQFSTRGAVFIEIYSGILISFFDSGFPISPFGRTPARGRQVGIP
jgi:hypothetical protein